MHRRRLLQSLSAAALTGCAVAPSPSASPLQVMPDLQVMTVRGLIDASEMGVTLTHEHVIADLRPQTQQIAEPITPNVDEVIAAVGPHLQRIRDLGCRTLVDATGVGIGRDARIVRALSEHSGLHMMCATGAYGAFERQFLPAYAREESAEALAARWTGEWHSGIEDTDIRPGLIKLSVDERPLDDLDRKLMRAGALAHRATGLTIGVHCGAGVPAMEIVEALAGEGVAASALIWIHAQNEADENVHVRAARQGAWISLDGFRAEHTADYVARVGRLRAEGLIEKVLLSQDAGWYWVGEPNGGRVEPYAAIFTDLIPALRAADFSQAEIDTLFVRNPAQALGVRVRAL